ncbi:MULTISPECIES: hypothetical protein [unclassified Sphingomonas]|uniref:hypothetical protein n=1 Tax=unclassified Sphingomonas TaxID=196159 RepID=UPI000BD8EDE3|nr:MAG: hypothetical protein B7Z43_10130 [Sphingomonas sp. 12-62-6]OYX36799.1 MAG: hypothetical protein B7Y98_14625 [Sphingomonas sp. 32-62-10]
MIRRLILLIVLTGLLVGLGSCDWGSNRSPYQRRETQAEYDRRVYNERRAYEERLAREEDRRARKAAISRDRRDNGDIYDMYDTPATWLSLDYACSGELRRAQWLVCDNDQLGLLHRRLALQWEAARRTASPERVNVLIAQQHAFIGERNACEDVGCVANAYYRYLDGSSFPAKPWIKPHPRPYAPKHAVKWVQKRGHGHHGQRIGKDYGQHHDGHPRPSHEARSCVSEIGFAAASQLAGRCDQVTPGLSSQCSVHNSCGGIRAQTDRGCGMRSNKPRFCRNY